jgi:hypothetical protein
MEEEETIESQSVVVQQRASRATRSPAKNKLYAYNHYFTVEKQWFHWSMLLPCDSI